MNRTLSVILIYISIALLISLLVILVWPTLQKQISDFIMNIPQIVQGLRTQIISLQQNSYFSAISKDSGLSDKLSEYANKGFSLLSSYANSAYSFVSNFIVVIGTFPIILFFLLRESEKAPETLLKIVPRSYRSGAKQTLIDIDSALSGYISGKMLSTILLGVMTYISFLIIGLPYALLLAIVLAFISFIPFIGSFLGAIPPLIVAFTQSPEMALWLILAVFICQQIQDNVLSPYIHPFTTIIILLVAGSIAGLMGMLLALPVYMVIKIITQHLYQLFFADKVHEMTDQ
jgi:predicted PurR-regulated permease PerM